MRGRGLKQHPHKQNSTSQKSPPMRGRGLKLEKTGAEMTAKLVAPHAGAWIETLIPPVINNLENRRPPCGGVD